MRLKRKYLVFFTALFFQLEIFSHEVYATNNTDVYVVYTGKSKRDKNKLKNVIPEKFTVRAYNADLLSLTDYSGKHKVISKISRAKMIVILHDAAMDIMKGTNFNTDLLIVNSVKSSVNSSKLRLFVVAKGTNISNLGDNVKMLEAANVNDLAKMENIKSSEVILVGGGSLDTWKAVSLIVDKIMENS